MAALGFVADTRVVCYGAVAALAQASGQSTSSVAWPSVAALWLTLWLPCALARSGQSTFEFPTKDIEEHDDAMDDDGMSRRLRRAA